MTKIKTVSKALMDIDALNIKLTISIDQAPRGAWSIYETSNGNYLTLKYNTSVVLTYKPKDNSHTQSWNRSDSIYINQRNIYKIKNGLRLYYDNILQKEDTYVYNHNEVCDFNKDNSCRVVIYLGQSQYISLEPTILYDKEQNAIPGILLMINIKRNQCLVSIDEYEMLMDLFETININLEGSQLFNSYLSLSKSDLSVNSDNSNINKPKITGSIFQNVSEIKDKSEDIVTGSLIKKPPTDLESL